MLYGLILGRSDEAERIFSEKCALLDDVVSRESTGSTAAFFYISSNGYAVVLGNEVKGVQQVVVDHCDSCLEIPQFGTKHSLNVSVTAGIVVWEFARRLLM